MTWTKVAQKNDIAPGKSQEFEINGKKIAVFNQDGFHALDGICVQIGRASCRERV